ncbi:hypothetical protein B5P43_19490 [Bacillus sp. SRB_336]|nr:hypothetical protein B5P43_19490 [Bacillus sp. SRB_336]
MDEPASAQPASAQPASAQPASAQPASVQPASGRPRGCPHLRRAAPRRPGPARAAGIRQGRPRLPQLGQGWNGWLSGKPGPR